MQNPLFDTSGPDDKYAITCPQCGYPDFDCINEFVDEYEDSDGYLVAYPVGELECLQCGYVWTDRSEDPRNTSDAHPDG